MNHLLLYLILNLFHLIILKLNYLIVFLRLNSYLYIKKYNINLLFIFVIYIVIFGFIIYFDIWELGIGPNLHLLVMIFTIIIINYRILFFLFFLKSNLNI